MCTRSGGLVTISEVKIKLHPRFLDSLQVRITLLLSVFAISACLIFQIAALNNMENTSLSVRSSEIQNQCTILCSQILTSDYLSGAQTETIDAELAQLSNIYGGRVVIINEEFQIVKDTYELQQGKTIVSEDVVKCYQGQQVCHYDKKNRYIEVATPIMHEEEKHALGMMLISVPTDEITEAVDRIQKKAWLILFTVVLVFALLSGGIGVLLVKPLKRMSQSIEEMSEGYAENHLHENAYLETKQISEAFNKLWDRYKVLDASRDEFVANVSHELKTPLTSMKVLSDSLLAQPDTPAELYREFMGDLSQEIERENKIINDLLSLVKLDKKDAGLTIQNEHINELVERILKRLQPLAAEQNIELVFESFRQVNAEVDAVKLSLVITNLVENAIKYNRENGWVHVALNADHKFFYLKVADSGIGIPKEDTEHIFERFYRVDKSHSREIGGTGLGLSIARNAVIMHRGAIKVHSEPGEGTTFTVRIPLTYVSGR